MARILPALAVALVLGAPGLEAQKSPTAARIIGVIPGAGHVYAGETGRGLAFVGGMFGVLALGGMLLAADCIGQALNQDTCSGESPLVTLPFFGLWAWSIVDAGGAARRTNAERGLSASLMLAPTRSSSVPGLSLAFSYR